MEVHPNQRRGRGGGEQTRRQIKRLLNKKPPMTFQEIAEELGLSRERVRQLAKEEGVTGRQGGGLRGQRRYFPKE